ncbi:MAG: SpoIIE family protein phosphatase [Flavobacteriales bacterium]|nr:SpoIIE family protein phosphatase [Flavobacteriales bacterium]
MDIRRFFTILLFLVGWNQVSAQFSKPFVSNYTAKDYNAFFQNWDAIQDKHGLMYFANNYGVLIFNGKKWDVVSSPNEAIIRTLAIGPEGKVVAGGYNQIGIIEIDEKGNPFFVSLSDQLPEEEQNFGSVWNIVVEPGVIYFSSDHFILKYQNNELKTIMKREGKLFERVRKKIYTTTLEYGLAEFKDSTINQLPGGEFFKEMRVYSVAACRNGLMVVTRDNGLYYYSSDTIYEVGDDKTKEIFITSQLYSATELPDGNICLSTLKNGAIVINQLGEIQEIFNSESGVQNQTCWNTFHDKQGNLWLMLDKGITKIEYNSPFSLYNQNVGIDGTIMNITRFNKNLYLATSVGLYEVVKEETPFGDKLSFNLKPEIKSQCWDLLEVNDNLLIATSSGIYTLDKNGKIIKRNNDIVYALEKSNYYSNLIFVGKENEFSFVVYNNSWKEYKIDTLKYQIRSIYEESDENIWLGTYIDGAIDMHYKLNADFSPKKINLNAYSVDQGLLGYEVDVFTYGNDLVFSTDKGLMKKKETSNGEYQFYADTTLGKMFSNGTRLIYRLQEDYLSNIWMYAPVTGGNEESSLGYIKLHNGNSIWNYEQFNRLPQGIIYAFYPELNGDIWLGGVEGLIKYNYLKNTVKFNSIFYTLINKVSLAADSTIYNGSFSVESHFSEIDYEHNSIQFEFSSTNFLDEKRNQYQFFLEGFDEHWSEWSYDTKKQYTNLFEGEYVFKVRSKNTYNNKGIEASFKFKILPPWFRTWYAYSCYFIIFIIIIWLVVRLSIYRLKVANEKLEKTIEERTQEIREKNTQLADALSDIKDSITYAKRLQDAILPKKEEIKKMFPKSFIFYQPRDIVSGDFYWLSQQKNKKIFVVADCTGHGVPGAFVSMLGNDLLNHIINEKKVDDTSLILTQLNQGVLNAFKSDNEQLSSNDGMDIAVVTINEKNELEYSGAQRPIFIVRDNELIELKPDKKSIGGRTKYNFVFEKQTIELQQNDVVYMFSDGFADQFGGPKGKKFLIKQLKDLLVKVAKLEPQVQMEIISENFNDWKGHLNQLDDVLLSGIKIS